MSAKQLNYAPDPNKFDFRTHTWDSQGNLTAKNTYRTYIVEGGATYYERPVNSGNLWNEANQPAGRVELTFGTNGTVSSKKFDFAATHREWTAPLTGAAAVHYELEQSKARNAELEQELKAIRAERAVLPAEPAAAAPAAEEAPKRPTLKRST